MNDFSRVILGFLRGVDLELCTYVCVCVYVAKVTMADRAAAERACKDPNPIIDGRKANVNLAYLGAKPRIMQPGFAFGVQQLHPALIQRPFGDKQAG
ncbi:unnamed protein product [Gulo gulo]|uniref:RNA-binding protein 24 n=1 Tax=Gulo gulo TaxID=48420 RepID=A0A9X9LSE0_GULGU|nr:unnamed protein product [Gulo gulo]